MNQLTSFIAVVGSFLAAATIVVILDPQLVRHPSWARAPSKWHVEGVHRLESGVGRYWFRPNPVGDDHRDPQTQLVHDDSVQPVGDQYGLIYCTGGQQPIVVSDQVVGCQSAH